MNRSIWPSPSELFDKPWGKERMWSTFGSLQGKVLYIDKGMRTSMKMFEQKDEVLYIQSGDIKATVANESIFKSDNEHFRNLFLHEGDVLSIQAGCPYRLEAESDAIVVEISGGSPSSGCVRFLDDFGRESDDKRLQIISDKLAEMDQK